MRRLLSTLLFLAVSLPALGGTSPEMLRIESKILGEVRNAVVRLPPSYSTGNRSYPVLYMTDGDWQLPHTAATADFLARQGRMPEVIIVGIINTDRTRDLTPTHVEATNVEGMTYEFPTSGGGDRFLAHVASELIPAVEEKYRTTPFRFFAGHSFGGLFALHSMMERPKLFKAWIAVSPSLNWDNGYIFKRAEEFFEKQKELHASLVVTMGNEGPTNDEAMKRLEQQLDAAQTKGLDYRFIHFDDEDHGSVVLPSHYAAFRKVFDGWRYTIPAKADPKSLYPAVTQHYARLSDRFGYTIPIPEVTANAIGYRLLSADLMDDAIAVFKANVGAYPQSANVYDSLGEAYEKAGRMTDAKANYEIAVKNAKKRNEPALETYKRNYDRAAKAARK
ncbi:MAG TPA: alpha/beta hydrolase-fold protein [Thermoanaerobaculia bacterium]